MKKIKYIGILAGVSLAIAILFGICAGFLFHNIIVGVVVCAVGFVILLFEFFKALSPNTKLKKSSKNIGIQQKPYGSKENPVVVGDPENSNVLVYDEKNGRWILTDGLGNGWIR